jgi:outer membrane receptor protein involved in Fe transport
MRTLTALTVAVSLFDFNVNNSPSTAIVIDEVYQPSMVMGSAGIFDLERVQVLKGPQAGLYGRNAVGGVVQMISRTASPGDEDGYVTLDYDSWSRYRARLQIRRYTGRFPTNTGRYPALRRGIHH